MDKNQYLKDYMRRQKILSETVYLQGIGRVKAKKIKDFNIGEKLGYNYGSTAEILKKQIKGKSAKLKIKTEDGNIYDVIKRMDTMWAIG